MDMQLTLAAIQQDREAALHELARQRDARESIDIPVPAEAPAAAFHVLARAGAILGRLLMRPRLSRPQA